MAAATARWFHPQDDGEPAQEHVVPQSLQAKASWATTGANPEMVFVSPLAIPPPAPR